MSPQKENGCFVGLESKYASEGMQLSSPSCRQLQHVSEVWIMAAHSSLLLASGSVQCCDGSALGSVWSSCTDYSAAIATFGPRTATWRDVPGHLLKAPAHVWKGTVGGHCHYLPACLGTVSQGARASCKKARPTSREGGVGWPRRSRGGKREVNCAVLFKIMQ